MGFMVSKAVAEGKEWLHVSGVDFGTYLEIAVDSPRAVIVRSKGHMEWDGIGRQSYQSPRYIVFEYGKKGKEVTNLGTEFEYTGRGKAPRMAALKKATVLFNKIKSGKG